MKKQKVNHIVNPQPQSNALSPNVHVTVPYTETPVVIDSDDHSESSMDLDTEVQEQVDRTSRNTTTQMNVGGIQAPAIPIGNVTAIQNGVSNVTSFQNGVNNGATVVAHQNVVSNGAAYQNGVSNVTTFQNGVGNVATFQNGGGNMAILQNNVLPNGVSIQNIIPLKTVDSYIVQNNVATPIRISYPVKENCYMTVPLPFKPCDMGNSKEIGRTYMCVGGSTPQSIQHMPQSITQIANMNRCGCANVFPNGNYSIPVSSIVSAQPVTSAQTVAQVPTQNNDGTISANCNYYAVPASGIPISPGQLVAQIPCLNQPAGNTVVGNTVYTLPTSNIVPGQPETSTQLATQISGNNGVTVNNYILPLSSFTSSQPGTSAQIVTRNIPAGSVIFTIPPSGGSATEAVSSAQLAGNQNPGTNGVGVVLGNNNYAVPISNVPSVQPQYVSQVPDINQRTPVLVNGAVVYLNPATQSTQVMPVSGNASQMAATNNPNTPTVL